MMQPIVTHISFVTLPDYQITQSMEKPLPYVEKELSWLSFNERVLQEAADTSVPIIERVRFLGIFSNNLDEFFRVRVADVKRRLLINQQEGEDADTRHLLSKIQNKVLKLQDEFDSVYMDVVKGLARHNIYLIDENQLSESQGIWLHRYFRNKVLRYIAPIIIDERSNLAGALKDDLTYLVAELRDVDSVQYAAVEVPTKDAARFVELPKQKGSKRKNIILLDNIIRHCADDIFKPFFDYEECHSYSMKMTRDAAYGLQDDIDQSLVEQMEEGLKQRLTAMPVRFVHERDMPKSMVDMLKERLGVTTLDAVVPGGRYHNFRDFIGFPNASRSYLEYDEIPALNSGEFDSCAHAFEAIARRDILLYYPYHKFRYFTEFLRQAAFDPQVKEIKICIYRLARDSIIVKSLVDAVENHKKVTVFIELAARFDEEANIEWAKELTESNVKVEFGIPSLKAHSKICLVTRLEGKELVRYAHIGTGNFNEKTARIYTDFSLFTAHEGIAGEVDQVFDFMQYSYKHYEFEHLIVSPNVTRKKLYELVDAEIEAANNNRHAEIKLKINNIDDEGVIAKLYAASNAGVKIKMIVRGMCSLVPGVEGFSQNIEIISIVDRLLEHPRVMIFHAGGEEKIYMMSFDLMTRNLDRRVEVGCPIYDSQARQRILDIFDIQWSDTTKARTIDKEQSNFYKPRGNKRKVRSQIEIHDYFKALETPRL